MEYKERTATTPTSFSLTALFWNTYTSYKYFIMTSVEQWNEFKFLRHLPWDELHCVTSTLLLHSAINPMGGARGI